MNFPLKAALVALCLTGISACDNNSTDNSTDKMTDKKVEAAAKVTPSAVSADKVAEDKQAVAFEGKEALIAGGRVVLVLPQSFEKLEESSEFATIYSDAKTGYSLIAMTMPAPESAELLKTQLQQIIDAQKAQGANFSVLEEGVMKAGELEMQKILTQMTHQGQQAISYSVFGIVGDKQLGLQFSAPATDKDAFLKTVDQILASIEIIDIPETQVSAAPLAADEPPAAVSEQQQAEPATAPPAGTEPAIEPIEPGDAADEMADGMTHEMADGMKEKTEAAPAHVPAPATTAPQTNP